ncbi:MAG: hypothetical protein LPK85_09215 [Gammaproteobacteria bacterium]|nr:hypothetical protein [Gammaproteobacteria bacterium]
MLDNLNEYQMIWLAYLAGTVLVYLFVCRISRPWYRLPKTLWRATAAVALLTPLESASTPGWLFPAAFSAVFEFLFGEPLKAVDAFANLTLAAGFALVLVVVDYGVYRWRLPRPPVTRRSVHASQAPAAR